MEVEPKNSSMFIFTWSISNFRHCEPLEHIKSPEFEVEFLADSKFHLELYPRGFAPGFISIYLHQEKEYPTFFYRILALKRHDDFKMPKENEMTEFSPPYRGYDQFYPIRKLKSYLMSVSGTLTVYCCILKRDTDIPMTVRCSAYTEIKVTELLYTWVLKDVLTSNNLFFSNINRTAEIPNFSPEIPSFKIRFFVKPDSDDKFIHFAMESLVGSRTFYLMYDIALLDSNGSKAHSVNGQSLFEKSTTKEIVEFAFLSKRKLLLDKQLYLPNGELTLQCEFSICTNDVENHIETIEYGSTKDLHFESENEPKPFTLETDHWDRNTLQLYEEGNYSDFIIRSASRDFPVHKAILSAQSEVFSDVFEQNMKNQNTGVLEIKDFDDYTIIKMLMFIYRYQLGELDYDCYLKLFSAADRYKIVELRKHCLQQLHYMDYENASNVCDVLVLADTHEEEELKTCAQQHILENACNIINTEAWKRLMDTHPPLTSEIMQKIICTRILKEKDPKNLGCHWL